MKGIRPAIVALALSAGGCTHLQQAPLVYSSKISVGVDIATTSTETPGIAFNLGYKQVDAAYVPVAVARTCKDGETGCNGAIQLIKGDSKATADAGDVNTQDVAKAERLSEAAAELEKATKSAEDARNTLAALRRDELAMNAEYDRLSKKYPWAVVGSTAPAPAADAATELLPSADERQALTSFAANQKELQGRIQAAAKDADALGHDLEEKRKLLVAAANDAANVTRNDAYSVFGSFSGKADGKATGEAKVGLGKIFATGVASQNISDGLAEAYKRQPNAAAECYKVVAGAKPDAATLLKLLEACQQQVSN